MKKSLLLLGVLSMLIIIACSNIKADNTTDTISETPIESINSIIKPAKELSSEFKKYWYAGNAEISSYELEQARYGEIRKGKAVLVYVTEDFLPKEQVKADYQNPENIPVLKLKNLTPVSIHILLCKVHSILLQITNMQLKYQVLCKNGVGMYMRN